MNGPYLTMVYGSCTWMAPAVCNLFRILIMWYHHVHTGETYSVHLPMDHNYVHFNKILSSWSHAVDAWRRHCLLELENINGREWRVAYACMFISHNMWSAMEKQTTRDFSWKSHFGYGMTQNLLYSSTVKEPGSKKAPKPSYAQKLNTGHSCLNLQFFEKRSVLYVHCSTFNVSVYALYYTTRFVRHNEFAGKDGHGESAGTPILVLRRRYRGKRWTLRFVSCLWSFV